MQNQSYPSFFLTSTMALHYGEWEGQMVPPSSISWMCWHTSSTRGGAMRQNLSSFSSLMMCFMASVHHISFGSREKMWWNFSSSAMAFCTNSGGQSLRQFSPPSFFRVARRSSYLCGTVSLAGWGTSGSSSSSFLNNFGEHWASGTVLVATTRPMTPPMARCMDWVVKFHSTMVTLWLPSLSSVYILMTHNPLGRSALSSR